MYYDMDGQPLDTLEWARLFELRGDGTGWWIIGQEERGDVKVSTVWIGLDHSFGFGPPLIFESMVFGGDFDGEMARYSTREEAMAGHQRLCLFVFDTVDGTAVEEPKELTP